MARPLTLAGVFAHPDDESWSLAGVFAVLVPKGVRGVVWTATRGQAGQIAADSGATRETLPRVREAEERAAMASVGVDRVVFGEPDHKAGFCGSLGNLVQDARLNHRVTLTSGILADRCGELLTRFFRDRR